MEARTKLADTRLKLAEAERKELEVQRKRLAEEEEAAKAQARGPLREEVLRIFYADPGEIANTLQGILGLPDRTIDPCRVVEAEKAGFKVKFSTGGGAVSGPIAEPPFSQLFGPPRPPEELPPPPPLPPEVVAKGLAIRAYCPTNSLFLRLYAADLERIKKLIREQLDVPLPQVKIEARMEVLDRSALEQIGIQWGGAGVAHPNPDKTPALVGRGFATPVFPGGTPTVGSFGPNPNFNPSGSGTFNFLPVDPTSGIPTGGSIVNLPVSALPTTLGGPAFGALFGLVGKSYNLDLALQALATQGKTRTLARPEIITMENSRATVSLGEEIPYATVSSAGTQVQFKEALLKLEVVPTVLAGEKVAGREQTKIKMVVVVENNSRGETVNLGTSGQPPAINKRKAETLVLINEGERLVISGVTTATRRDTVRKVPILGDIPLLGWLFKQKENFEEGRELVIFITPSVLQLVQGRLAAPAPAR
jgi:type IV pilus assembly protein PilQ